MKIGPAVPEICSRTETDRRWSQYSAPLLGRSNESLGLQLHLLINHIYLFSVQLLFCNPYRFATQLYKTFHAYCVTWLLHTYTTGAFSSTAATSGEWFRSVRCIVKLHKNASRYRQQRSRLDRNLCIIQQRKILRPVIGLIITMGGRAGLYNNKHTLSGAFMVVPWCNG